MPVISTQQLTKTFDSITALDGVTVDVPDEGVIGLLGPNGSGKSTLIRVLLGLIPPTAGTASVLGEPVTRPSAYASRTGVLIESPTFLPGMSARRNLLALSRLRGLPPGRVQEVLALVGLTDRADEAVKRFSLGMKQRLGIAAALLPDPRLLILDEPTNGLDPAGIVEIRELLKDLGRSGRAVLVSSHLLSEIETVCDHLVVLRFGELLFAGPTSELLARTRGYVTVAPEFAADREKLREALTAAGFTVEDGSGDDELQVETAATDAAAVNRAAAAAGITVRHLAFGRDSLEDVFLNLTAGTPAAPTATATTAMTAVAR